MVLLLVFGCDAAEDCAGDSLSIVARFTHRRLALARVDCMAPGGTVAVARAAPCEDDAARE